MCEQRRWRNYFDSNLRKATRDWYRDILKVKLDPEAPIPMSEPIEAPSASSEPIEEIGTVAPAQKKKAIVVYEGDERWQPPKHTGFIADEESDEEGGDQDDEASTVSGSEEAETADLLAKFPSDSEVCLPGNARTRSLYLLRRRMGYVVM